MYMLLPIQSVVKITVKAFSEYKPCMAGQPSSILIAPWLCLMRPLSAATCFTTGWAKKSEPQMLYT